MLLHTEYSLLSLLHTQDGVVHHHGLFQVSGCLSPLLPVLPPQAGTCWGHIGTLGSSPLQPLCAGHIRTSWARWAGGQVGPALQFSRCNDHSAAARHPVHILQPFFVKPLF